VKQFRRGLILVITLGSLPLMFAGSPPGRAVARAVPSPSAPAEVQMSGTVVLKDGKYFLSDEKSHSTVELRGKAVKRYAGKRVSVTGHPMAGATLSAGLTAVIVVSKIGTAVAVAGAATAAATTAGVSAVALTTLGITTATAGTLGGLYASGAISEDQPASRP
jgi:hypothetical protein